MRGTDIYLIDQILKGRYDQIDRILDVGCGSGRNMVWFAQNDFEIYGSDREQIALEMAKENTDLPADRFVQCPIEQLTYEKGYFHHVICNAVLHFAASQKHFMQMMDELYRVLQPGGSLFIRMTSVFGLPQNYRSLGKGRYFLKDGSERFLLTPELLDGLKTQFNFKLLEPVKSVLVEDLRSMTTLVLQK